jgi:hypothetical protein
MSAAVPFNIILFKNYFAGIPNAIIEAGKIDGLKEEFARLREEVRVDRAKTNTRLNILIAILSTLAVPIVGVCVKLLFG